MVIVILTLIQAACTVTICVLSVRALRKSRRAVQQWTGAYAAEVEARAAWQEVARIEHAERVDALGMALNLAIALEAREPSPDNTATVSALVSLIADLQLAGDTLIPSPVDPT